MLSHSFIWFQSRISLSGVPVTYNTLLDGKSITFAPASSGKKNSSDWSKVTLEDGTHIIEMKEVRARLHSSWQTNLFAGGERHHIHDRWYHHALLITSYEHISSCMISGCNVTPWQLRIYKWPVVDHREYCQRSGWLTNNLVEWHWGRLSVYVRCPIACTSQLKINLV